jgi:hypothetical protein
MRYTSHDRLVKPRVRPLRSADFNEEEEGRRKNRRRKKLVTGC